MEGQQFITPPPPLPQPPPIHHENYLLPSTSFHHDLIPSLLPPAHGPEMELISPISGPTTKTVDQLHNLQHSSEVSENMHDDGNIGNIKNRRRIARNKSKFSSIVPRFEFQTRTEADILDDGQKAVKNCNFPRSYYRCTHHTCSVKKQVQRRLSNDNDTSTTIVVTTYQGTHNHPSEKLMETLSPLLNQIQLLVTSTNRF